MKDENILDNVFIPDAKTSGIMSEKNNTESVEFLKQVSDKILHNIKIGNFEIFINTENISDEIIDHIILKLEDLGYQIQNIENSELRINW